MCDSASNDGNMRGCLRPTLTGPVGAANMLQLVKGGAPGLIYLLESAHTFISWDSSTADDRNTQHVFGN